MNDNKSINGLILLCIIFVLIVVLLSGCGTAPKIETNEISVDELETLTELDAICFEMDREDCFFDQTKLGEGVGSEN